VKAFLDTNILVYAVSDDPRRARAGQLIAEGSAVSVQVLNEFVNVLRKKLGRTWPEIETAVADLRLAIGPAIPVTEDLHDAAIPLARDHGLSFYDALIVAAAYTGGCHTLFSEGLQHGRKFDDLTIINPFIDRGEDLLDRVSSGE